MSVISQGSRQEFITTGEAASMCNVTSQTIINWLDQGKFSYERTGNGPRKIVRAHVEAFIEANRKQFPAKQPA